MSFENTTAPLSLFTDDGELSHRRSDSMHKLEEKISQEITTYIS